jgi:hypothetical protein
LHSCIFDTNAAKMLLYTTAQKTGNAASDAGIGGGEEAVGDFEWSFIVARKGILLMRQPRRPFCHRAKAIAELHKRINGLRKTLLASGFPHPVWS